MNDSRNHVSLLGAFVVLSCLSAVGQDAPYQFQDVAETVGLLPAAADIMGHGAGWGDVDGDGWADLYIGTFHYKDSKPNLLLRNHDGKFTLSEQSSLRISTRATGVLFVDLDNDGDLDLYVASMPAPDGSRLASRLGHPMAGCSLFRNDGKGSFTNVSAASGACPTAFGGRSVTTLDYDGDGRLDLLVGEEPVTGYNGSQTRTSRLFRNRGKLRFEDVTQAAGIPEDAAGLGVAAADVNQDGWPDIFLASTLGNFLLINERNGRFVSAPGADKTFAWPTAKGDDMVCGVSIADVNGDALPDIVLGQHYSSPWVAGVANRLYLHRGSTPTGMPKYDDVTDLAGLVPLPLKGPHVELQDFDNDGKVDLYTSIVKFADKRPHPVIFRNLGARDGVPRFKTLALGVNDFPTADDRAIRRSGTFFEKMIQDKKILYTAPGPTCDFDRDGRLDMVMPNWWSELPTMLLRNETPSKNWLQVQVKGNASDAPPPQAKPDRFVNRMGIGCNVVLYDATKSENSDSLPRLGWREIAAGYGYASGQEAIAHFGLGDVQRVDIEVVLPHGQGRVVRHGVKANQRVTISVD